MSVGQWHQIGNNEKDETLSRITMLSIGRLIQYSIIYGMYYLFRVALVKQWKTGASPKVALDFNGYYSILKQLFDLKASIQLTLPNLFSTHINIEISNHMAEVENRPARRESIAPADVCRMSKQNKIKESAPAKGNVGDSQKELAKVKNVEANEIEPKENNNFEPRAAGQESEIASTESIIVSN